MTQPHEVPCVFEASDFESKHPLSNSLGPKLVSSKDAADIANAKLARLIESWPVASGDTNSDTGWAFFVVNNGHTSAGATHTARLAFITPLAKVDDCPHEPEYQNKIPGWHHSPESKVQCRFCKLPMKPTWTVSE